MLFSYRFRYFIILLLSVYSFLNIYFTVGEKLFDFQIPGIYIFAVLTAVVTGVWELNRFAEIYSLRWTSARKKINPLIIVFLVSLVNVVVVSTVALALLYVALGQAVPVDFAHITLLSVFGFRVNLFLNCVNAIVYYMNRYRQSQVEAEQLKKVSVEAQFEALRNQINPHFLFNCFNVLSTLVYKDAETSARFIAQLSHVYRYLLYNQEKKVVPLKEELAFTESYFFLLSIRFGDNIVIRNRFGVPGEELFIAPAVLQMLVENAIKHNVVSRKNPLTVELFRLHDMLVVSNTLQEKEVREESSRIGLKNIIERYRLLTDRPVEVIRTEKAFTVKVPLLYVEQP